MTIFSTKGGLTYREKLDFMGKIIGTYRSSNLGLDSGFIHKFNNAYGFKDVQFSVDGGAYFDPKVPTPENYRSPESMLIRGQTFLNQPGELISFVVSGRRMLHPDKKYSYEPMDILFKFQKFLYKIFPDIRIAFDIKDENYKLSLQDYALGHFLSCYAYSEIAETEFSAPRLLKQKEIDYIMGVLSQVVEGPHKIYQAWCETCYGYDKNTPYHICVEREEENV